MLQRERRLRRLSPAGFRPASLAASRFQSHGTYTRSGIVRHLRSRRETHETRIEDASHSDTSANTPAGGASPSAGRSPLSLSIVSKRERTIVCRVREGQRRTAAKNALFVTFYCPFRRDRLADSSATRDVVVVGAALLPPRRNSGGPLLLLAAQRRQRRLHRGPSDDERVRTHASNQRFSKCPSGISTAATVLVVVVVVADVATLRVSLILRTCSSPSFRPRAPSPRAFLQVQLAAPSKHVSYPLVAGASLAGFLLASRPEARVINSSRITWSADAVVSAFAGMRNVSPIFLQHRCSFRWKKIIACAVCNFLYNNRIDRIQLRLRKIKFIREETQAYPISNFGVISARYSADTETKGI